MKDHKSGFTDINGKKVRSGKKVFHLLLHKFGIVEDILQDGDATLTSEDGAIYTVKWKNLILINDCYKN